MTSISTVNSIEHLITFSKTNSRCERKDRDAVFFTNRDKVGTTLLDGICTNNYKSTSIVVESSGYPYHSIYYGSCSIFMEKQTKWVALECYPRLMKKEIVLFKYTNYLPLFM